MKQNGLLFLTLFSLTQITGCAPLVIGANMLAGGVMSKSSAERKADKCYEIDTQAAKEKVSRPERNRRLSKMGCPI